MKGDCMASRNGIADALRELILSGELKPGDRVPSSRELVAEYGGGKATALAAIRVLADEGLVTTGDKRKAIVRDRDEAVRSPEARLAATKGELRAIRAKVVDLRHQLDDLERHVVDTLAQCES